MKNYSALEKYEIIDPILKTEATAGEVAVAYGLPCRTLRYWKKQFLQYGLVGLKRKKRSDQGRHHSIPEELLQLTQALALQKPAWTIAAIYRKIKELSERQGYKPAVYGTIYHIVKSMNPALLTLAHQGGKAYLQKYELIYRRECQEPNEIWQVDHSQLDIYLLDGKAIARKPWLTIVIDDFSRAICGYFLSFDAPSALHTALALRQAIWRKNNPSWPMCGIPQILYTDHGADFMSLHIEQVCIKLKIRMINSRVGRPQGRGKIERFFETVNENVLQSLPGYCLKGKIASKPSLSLESLQQLLESFIIEHYHHQVHSTTGETPVNRWTADGFLPQLPDSLQDLDLLLLCIDKPRKIQRDGIQFQGLRYIAPTLAGYVGEQVTIRYDPRDLAEIRVYYQDVFLCSAICQDIAEMVVSLKEIQKARRQVKEGLYQQIKNAKHLIKTLLQQRESQADGQVVKTSEKKTSSAKSNLLKRYEND